MLVEKEIIAPGQYWYTDETTGMPRKLDVSRDMTKYWCDQGTAMLSSGLTVPVPCEHDFQAHPMTPKERLTNNAGWVKEFRIKDVDGRKGVLFGVVDVQDPDIAKKLPHTIRWTSPWINSFTDGSGKQWNNVISHLALTTRPRVVKQAPFPSVAAALSMATDISLTPNTPTTGMAKDGLCLSRAGRIVRRKRDGRLVPQFPFAFSLYSGGIKFAGDDEEMEELTDEGEEMDDAPPPKGGKPGTDTDSEMSGLMNPLQDSGSDVKMEELLCDLLQALGVPMPDQSNENEFKRHLYEAAMAKVKELTSKGMTGGKDPNMPDQNQPTDANPHTSQPNPLIQQEQQPMYMSLEEINKLPDPTMKAMALSMYNAEVKANARMAEAEKQLGSLREVELKKAAAARQMRIDHLGRVSPRVKADLSAMVAMPSMALSMGDGGVVNDPMATTLAVLEKGLSDMPRLLTTESAAFTVQPQPTDANMLTEERSNEVADSMARMMGCPPEPKRAG